MARSMGARFASLGAARPAQGRAWGRLQGAVIAVGVRGSDRRFQGNFKESTPMGPSKHRASRTARRGNRFAVSFVCVIVAVAFLFGLTASAGAQGAVRSVHGDWQIRCDTPPGAQGEQCALIQSVGAEDRSNA